MGKVNVHWKSGRPTWNETDFNNSIFQDEYGVIHTTLPARNSSFDGGPLYLHPDIREQDSILLTASFMSAYLFDVANPSLWNIRYWAFNELTNVQQTVNVTGIEIPINEGPAYIALYTGNYQIDLKSVLSIDAGTSHIRVGFQRVKSAVVAEDAADIYQILGFTDEVEV